MKKIQSSLFLLLTAIIFASCNVTTSSSGGGDLFVKFKKGDTDVSFGKMPGYMSSGNSLTGSFGFGKSAEGSIKLKGILKDIKDSESFDALNGKTYDMVLKQGKEAISSEAAKATITSVAATGKKSKMFGDELTIKGTFSDGDITDGTFAIKAYKKNAEEAK